MEAGEEDEILDVEALGRIVEIQAARAQLALRKAIQLREGQKSDRQNELDSPREVEARNAKTAARFGQLRECFEKVVTEQRRKDLRIC